MPAPPQPPGTHAVKIGVSDPAPFVGDKVTLTVAGANGSPDPTGAMWTFGDGTPDENSLTPTHIYTRPGNYLITVTATGRARLAWRPGCASWSRRTATTPRWRSTASWRPAGAA